MFYDVRMMVALIEIPAGPRHHVPTSLTGGLRLQPKPVIEYIAVHPNSSNLTFAFLAFTYVQGRNTKVAGRENSLSPLPPGPLPNASQYFL